MPMLLSGMCKVINCNMSPWFFFFGQEWEEKRRQNIEKMNEEMERIAEYERGQRVRVSVFMDYFYQVSSDAHVC